MWLRYLRNIILIILIQLLTSCICQHYETNNDSVKELYKYHSIDNKIKFLGLYDPLNIKADTSIITLFDFEIDSTTKEVRYLDSILIKIDTINYFLFQEVITFDLYLYDLVNCEDEESIILMQNYNPYLIYNYPWKDYLFIISDTTEKIIMKKVINDERLKEKINKHQHLTQAKNNSLRSGFERNRN